MQFVGNRFDLVITTIPVTFTSQCFFAASGLRTKADYRTEIVLKGVFIMENGSSKLSDEKEFITALFRAKCRLSSGIMEIQISEKLYLDCL